MTRQIRRTANHQYFGDRDSVMNLLTAGGEREWVPGWDPKIIHSEDELGTVPGTIFLSDYSDDGIESTWYLKVFDRERGRIEYVRVAPGLAVVELSFDLIPNSDRTEVTISFIYTSLGEAGDDYVAKLSEKRRFEELMGRWEVAVNRCLGKKQRV